MTEIPDSNYAHSEVVLTSDRKAVLAKLGLHIDKIGDVLHSLCVAGQTECGVLRNPSAPNCGLRDSMSVPVTQEWIDSSDTTTILAIGCTYAADCYSPEIVLEVADLLEYGLDNPDIITNG